MYHVLQYQTILKRIVNDNNIIFMTYYKSEDVNKKGYFEFQLIPILRLA